MADWAGILPRVVLKDPTEGKVIKRAVKTALKQASISKTSKAVLKASLLAFLAR